MKGLIEDMPTFCPTILGNNFGDNYQCKWHGKLCLRDSHLAIECQYSRVRCPHNGCLETVPRKNLSEHIKYELYVLL